MENIMRNAAVLLVLLITAMGMVTALAAKSDNPAAAVGLAVGQVLLATAMLVFLRGRLWLRISAVATVLVFWIGLLSTTLQLAPVALGLLGLGQAPQRLAAQHRVADLAIELGGLGEPLTRLFELSATQGTRATVER